MQKIKITVSGRVQGVGFRYTVLQTAQKLGIKGQVWNNDDGSVGILAQSDDPLILITFEKKIRNNFGHRPWIRVDYVDVIVDHSSDFSDFKITY